MINSILTGPEFSLLEKALDGSSFRQKLIAANIANVDTPGYKSLDYSFSDQLKEAMKNPGQSIKLSSTNPRHLQITSPEQRLGRITVQDSRLRNDGNSVDIDREMAKLSENELYYEAISRCINDEFRLLRSVIQGRG